MCVCFRPCQSLCRRTLKWMTRAFVGHLFRRQRVVWGGWGHDFFVKALNLVFVHLHDHWPLELHRGPWEGESLKQLNKQPIDLNQYNYSQNPEITHRRFIIRNLPSSPPRIEKSWSNTVHFWMRWALEVAFSLTRVMPSWIAAFMARSRPPAISLTRVALLPSLRHNSTASGVSSSSGAPVSLFTWHWEQERRVVNVFQMPR